MIKNFLDDESGATAIENGILVGFIALATMTMINSVHGVMIDKMSQLNTQFSNGGSTIVENN